MNFSINGDLSNEYDHNSGGKYCHLCTICLFCETSEKLDIGHHQFQLTLPR